MTPASMAPLLAAGPLAAAALLALVGSWLNRRVMDLAAFAVAVAVSCAAGWCAVQTVSGPAFHWTAGWVLEGSSASPLGIRLLVEPLGAGLDALAGLLLAATFVFSWRYFEEIGHMYHVLMLVLLGGLSGLCMAGDLFNLFVFLEIVSVAAYALTAYKVEESGLVGALNFALTNTIGGIFVLVGIALVYARSGVLDMTLAGPLLRGPDALTATALSVVLVGFLVKSAMAPFHFWLPDTYATAPTPVAVLFGGVMLEVGIFAASRAYWLVFAPSLGAPVALRDLLLTGGAVTAVIASIMSLLQRDLKRLLAFATIAHVALLVIGFGLLGVQALGGTAVAVLAHGPLMGALFLCAGIVRQRHKSVDEMRLLGRGGDVPLAGAVLLVSAVALAAPPFSAMHAGESLIEADAASMGYGWMPWLLIFVAACTTGAILRAGARIFLGWGPRGGVEQSGPESDDSSEDADTKGPEAGHPWVMLIPSAVLALVGAALSAMPAVRQGALAAAAHLMRQPVPAPEPLHVTLSSVLGPAGAVAVAVLLLSRHRAPATADLLGRAVAPVVRLLQREHTPHAGDHIGWLVLGAGIVLLVLNLAVS